MHRENLKTIDYRREFGLETVKMWRLSFQRALGLQEHNRWDELSDQLAYFQDLDPALSRVTVDVRTTQVVGLLTLSGEKLDHLFVHVDYQRAGIGKTLLDEAKARSPAGLTLYTFQRNVGAQQFYLSQGFVETERGFASFDGNPWAQSKSDLADIRYEWRPQPR